MKDKIIIITGPTGVGKTSLSIELAKEFNGEIISCDSFQIYKYMDIGTAKVTEKEMDGIIHHNINIVEPNEEFNTALFKDRTVKLIENVISKGKLPFLVGGTGLYLQSIISNLDFSGGEANGDQRKEIEKLIEEEGSDFLYNKLINIDENIGKLLEKNNRHRLIRAYEIYLNTGESPAKHLSNLRNKESVFDYLYFIINDDREVLYENINRRVEEMVSDGLVKEVDTLLSKDYNFQLNSFKAIGYKEFEEYYNGNQNLDYVIDKIKQHSRNYAKRQLTWFRRVEDGIWMNKNEFSNKEDFINVLKNKIEEFLQ